MSITWVTINGSYKLRNKNSKFKGNIYISKYHVVVTSFNFLKRHVMSCHYHKKQTNFQPIKDYPSISIVHITFIDHLSTIQLHSTHQGIKIHLQNHLLTSHVALLRTTLCFWLLCDSFGFGGQASITGIIFIVSKVQAYIFQVSTPFLSFFGIILLKKFSENPSPRVSPCFWSP